MKYMTMMYAMAVLCISFAGCRPIPFQAQIQKMIQDGSFEMLDKIKQDINYGRWIKSDFAPAHIETQGTQRQEVENSGEMVVNVMSPNDKDLRQPFCAVEETKEPEYNTHATSGLYSGVIQNDPNDKLESSEDLSAPAQNERQGTQRQVENHNEMIADQSSVENTVTDRDHEQTSSAVEESKEPEYNRHATSGVYSGVIQNDPNDELESSADVSARAHIETQDTQRQVENHKEMIAKELSPVENTVTNRDFEQPSSAVEETKEPEYNRHATSGLYSGVIQNDPNYELEGFEDVSARAHIETQGTQQVENYKEMIADELSPVENTVTHNDVEQPSSAVEETIESEHNSHTTSGQFSDIIQNDANDEHESTEDVSGTDKKSSYVELRPEEVAKLLEIYHYIQLKEKPKKYLDVTTVTSPPSYKKIASNILDSIHDLGIKGDGRMKATEKNPTSKKEKLEQKMFHDNDKMDLTPFIIRPADKSYDPNNIYISKFGQHVYNIMVSQLDGDRGVVRPLDD